MFKKKERLASIVFVALLYLFLLTGLDAYAQPIPPSRDDLKAAYCISYLRLRSIVAEASLEEPRTDFSRDFQKEIKDWAIIERENAGTDFARLQAFLEGRTIYLHPDSLNAARDRGLADSIRHWHEIMSCSTDCRNDVECLRKCPQRSATGLRLVKTCHDLSFLPF